MSDNPFIKVIHEIVDKELEQQAFESSRAEHYRSVLNNLDSMVMDVLSLLQHALSGSNNCEVVQIRKGMWVLRKLHLDQGMRSVINPNLCLVEIRLTDRINDTPMLSCTLFEFADAERIAERKLFTRTKIHLMEIDDIIKGPYYEVRDYADALVSDPFMIKTTGVAKPEREDLIIVLSRFLHHIT